MSRGHVQMAGMTLLHNVVHHGLQLVTAPGMATSSPHTTGAKFFPGMGSAPGPGPQLPANWRAHTVIYPGAMGGEAKGQVQVTSAEAAASKESSAAAIAASEAAAVAAASRWRVALGAEPSVKTQTGLQVADPPSDDGSDRFPWKPPATSISVRPG